jgi:hypothetical protein
MEHIVSFFFFRQPAIETSPAGILCGATAQLMSSSPLVPLLPPTCVWAKAWFADQAECRVFISRLFQSTSLDQLTGPCPPTPMPNLCTYYRRFTTAATAATSATRAPEAGRRSPFYSLRQTISFHVRSTSSTCGSVARSEVRRGRGCTIFPNRNRCNACLTKPAHPPALSLANFFSCAFNRRPHVVLWPWPEVRRRRGCAVTSQLPPPPPLVRRTTT